VDTSAAANVEEEAEVPFFERWNQKGWSRVGTRERSVKMSTAINPRRDLLRMTISGLALVLGLPACVGSRLPRAEAAPASAPPEQVVKIVARKWEFVPSQIVLRKGVPVVLEVSSADRHHGFNVPRLGVRGEKASAHPSNVEPAGRSWTVCPSTYSDMSRSSPVLNCTSVRYLRPQRWQSSSAVTVL
jgi:hypothetical protein